MDIVRAVPYKELTTEELGLIEEAFFNDCSYEEIAAHAGITMLQLQDHIALHTDNGWLPRMELLRHKRYALASVNLGKAILGGSVEDSKFVLERRRPLLWGKQDKLKHEGELEWKVTVAPFMFQKPKGEIAGEVIDATEYQLIDDPSVKKTLVKNESK